MFNSQYSAIPLADLVEAGNVGTDETILNSVMLPPGLFGRELGDAIRITAAFAYAANGNTKTIKLYFGASSSTVNGRVAADNGATYIIQALIVNKGSFQRSISTLFSGSNGLCINKINQYTENLNAPIRVRITGQSNAASDDVTSRLLKVEYVPVGSIVPA